MNSFEDYKYKKCKHLLFHGNDIVLIDKVIECSENYIIVNANLDKDSPFLDTYNGLKVFRTYKSIEMMAQSLGCFQYINMSMHGEGKAKIGFLLGARKFEIFIPHTVYNQELFIETRLSVQNDDGFGVYDSTIYVESIGENNKAASASLSVLSPKDDFFMHIQDNKEEK